MKSGLKRYSLAYSNDISDYNHIIDFEKIGDNFNFNMETSFKKNEDIKKGKHTLAEIDIFTNSFTSYEQFHNLVLYDTFDYDPNNVYIVYKYNGYNYLNVHFGNDELRKKALKVRNSIISDPIEINELVNLLTDNGEFWRYLKLNQDSFTIYDNTLLKLISTMRYNKRFLDYDLQDDKSILTEKLSNYKVFREVYLAKQSYFMHVDNPKVKTKKY